MKWHNQWARYRAQDVTGSWFEFERHPRWSERYGVWHNRCRSRVALAGRTEMQPDLKDTLEERKCLK